MTIVQLCDAIKAAANTKSEGAANEMMADILKVIEPGEHLSDCAHHNAPAYAPGLCDCGAVEHYTPIPAKETDK